MRAPADSWNMNQYWNFHKDHSHDTKKCITLCVEIERLIKDGKLARFVSKQRQQQKPPRGNDDRGNRDHRIARIIVGEVQK
jgi:hypothetical protein